MSEAPDRIWAIPEQPHHGLSQGVWDDEPDGQDGEVQYIRSDLHDAAVAKARNEAINEALKIVCEETGYSVGDFGEASQGAIASLRKRQDTEILEQVIKARSQ